MELKYILTFWLEISSCMNQNYFNSNVSSHKAETNHSSSLARLTTQSMRLLLKVCQRNGITSYSYRLVGNYGNFINVFSLLVDGVVNKDRPTNSTSQGTFLKPASRPPKEKETYTLPGEVYGVEHLARLFVHLPEYMSKAEIPRKHNLLISSHIQDMINYITSNLTRFHEAAIYEESTEQNPPK